MQVTILIVDDHDVLREGIRSILKRARPQWEICAEAATGQEAIQVASTMKPTVILLDITMPGMSGLEAAAKISAAKNAAKILMVTMHESGELANDARRVGAAGFPDRCRGRTCADAGGVRACWSSIVVRGRVMLEDVHDSAERLSYRDRTAHTSDRAGRSPARVAGKAPPQV